MGERRYHPVTAIVAAVYCERKMVYDRTYGDRRPLAVRAKALHGTVRHLQFELEGRAAQTVDRRCFIATTVYGAEAAETACLRAWRDHALLPLPAGRAVVRLYYALSPAVARGLARHPRLCRWVRLALDGLVRRLRGPL